MVGGVAKTFAKIAGMSVLFLGGLVLIVLAVSSVISGLSGGDANYIDMRAGSVSSRQVKIGPGTFHLKRIRTTGTAFVEIEYVRGPDIEICIRKSSAIVSKEIIESTCKYFHVLNKQSPANATFSLERGAFDLFISNKARFRSAQVTYSVDIRP